ncbi:tyrosine-type recombinase/integrase [Yoonia sp. SDW83-1]|uniref:tyrosine-type recombinase/integrase n=1 Tax=Yoonia sp. SDW83-1 TaxID=3366945 RepID=UPI00398C4FD0
MITKDLQLKALPKGVHKISIGLRYKSNGDGTGSFQGRYKIGGKLIQMSLGVYPTVRLSEANQAHAENRNNAKMGINPKQQKEETIAANLSSGTTFADILPLAYADIQRGWKNGGKGYGFMTKMDAIVIPAIGTMEISEIRPKHLADMARPLWHDKYPTIDKALLFTGQVLQWAEQNDYEADGGAAQRARKILKKSTYEQENQRSIPFADLPAFYATLGDNPSDLAFRFLILTVVRPGNAAMARYDQLEGDIWHLRPDDMKRRADHWVPLSDAALDVLAKADAHATRHAEITGKEKHFLFPSADSWQTGHVSMNNWTQSMRRANIFGSAHGMRATFKMWAELTTGYDNLLIEEVLHHAVRGAVEQAYIRGHLAELRRPLMQDWADFVTGKTDAKVLSPEDLKRLR